jgi:pyruvate/2-oxoglutarate dehydrogenase complex dihydrolipoamide acyltransferase (E2) component
MFRKIHSNRDPRDTLLSELRNEFKSHFEGASKGITQKLEKKPKFTFGTMIVLMAFSGVLSFTVFRNKAPAEKINKNVKVNAVSDGFSQILSASEAIKRALALKQQIDSLTAKKTLSKSDSEVLINDLDKLHQLNKPYSK